MLQKKKTFPEFATDLYFRLSSSLHVIAGSSAGPQCQPAVPSLQEGLAALRACEGKDHLRFGHPDRRPCVHRQGHPSSKGHGRHCD